MAAASPTFFFYNIRVHPHHTYGITTKGADINLEALHQVRNKSCVYLVIKKVHTFSNTTTNLFSDLSVGVDTSIRQGQSPFNLDDLSKVLIVRYFVNVL